MAKKISQRMARAYKRQAEETRQKVNELLCRANSQFGGKHVCNEISVSNDTMVKARLLLRFGYALFIVPHDTENTLIIRAASKETL